MEEPFSGQSSGVKAISVLGAAVLACELEGLPWTARLAKLKMIVRHWKAGAG